MSGTDSKITQLIFEVHKGESQFAYFLLGLAASAIAFAIHRTSDTALADAPWPLGIAVVLWASSFVLGCLGLDARRISLAGNAQLLRIMRDEPAMMSSHPSVVEAREAFDSKLRVQMNKPEKLFRCQQWVLFAGALAFVAGHVMQMAALPSASQPGPSHEAPSVATPRN